MTAIESTSVWRGIAIALCTATIVASSHVVAKTEASELLAPSQNHSKVSRWVTDMFEGQHYRQVKVDDGLSSEILDNYLDALDGNKMYFTATDIASFERWRFTLDDAVRNGKLDPVFVIFRIFQERAEERISFAKQVLEVEHDYDIDEDYVFDRDDLPWPKGSAELDEIWRLRVKNDLLSLHLTDKDHDESIKLLSSRYERVLKRTRQLKSDEVFETFMNAYADTLDPHSNFFSPRNAEEYRIQMSLSYDGIGASLNLTDDYVTVQSLIPGGPASMSDVLQPKDRITGVGQGTEGDVTDVVGWRLDDVVKLIRGPGGTTVRLQILAAGAAPGTPEEVVALKRDKVKLEAQAAQKDLKTIERDGRKVRVGVITVPSFYHNYEARLRGDPDYTSVTRDVRKLIEELREEGVDGMVMDLRGNGGGQLSEAVDLSGLFIDTGPVVQLRDSDGRVSVYKDRNPSIAYFGPLVVLVDRYSASASEIFAAAIQDYGRGIVVGQQTFGKGSVQNLYPIGRRSLGRDREADYGQLTLTIGKYYRITGGSTQHRGVIPDIELPFNLSVDDVGESTRPSALPWDQIKPTRYDNDAAVSPGIGTLRSWHEQRAADDPDFTYLLENIARTDDIRARKSVSLRQSQREEERESRELERLTLENERRVAHGLEPLATVEELDETEPVDVQLSEAAQIAADMVLAPVLTAASDDTEATTANE